MHFVLQTPSLQHLTGVKIVAYVWTQRVHLIKETFKCLKVYSLNEDRTEWKAIEEKVQSQLSALPLPQQCKQHLLNFVKPTGKEIIAWCHYHSKKRTNFQYLDILLGNHLRWSMHGTIDYAKTAELVVKDERVDLKRRYEVACINCLENEARELIQFIPENIRQEFMNQRTYLLEPDHHFLICYFTYTLTGQVIRTLRPSLFPVQSINKFLFNETLASGTRATCEYFFEKLKPEEKEQVVVECQKANFYRPQPPSCGSRYYLSLMNEENQERMFRERIVDVLTCLLGWPMQSLFVKAAECGRQFMNFLACSCALSTIAGKIYLGFRDYDYAHLFWEIWRLTSAEHKRDLLENFVFIDLLLGTKREEFIKLILNEAPASSILQLCTKLEYNIGEVLLDENVISEASLMESKQTALLNSSNEPEDAEKRLRSQHLTTLVTILMEKRMERRRLV